MLNEPIKGKYVRMESFSGEYPGEVAGDVNRWCQGEGKDADILDIIVHFKTELDAGHAVTGGISAIVIYANPEKYYEEYIRQKYGHTLKVEE